MFELYEEEKKIMEKNFAEFEE